MTELLAGRIEPRDEERKQILAARAQWRDHQAQLTQVRVQIAAKLPLLDARRERAVRRRDHASCVGCESLCSDWHDRALFQRPSHLGLDARHQLVNLFEEERAVVGGTEAPELCRAGTVCARYLAEQIALREIVWERGAVDRDERAPALAVLALPSSGPGLT